MYHANCNNSCSCNNSSNCNRNGERIMVNQSNCSNHNVQERSRCSCANTYRPGSGCGNSGNHSCGCHNNCNCGCQRPCPPRPCPPRPCPPRPCPPRPCPPRPCPPRPSCEDRRRAQYRQCMRNCRMREDEQGFERGYEEGQYDTDMMNEDRWEYED